MLALRRSKNAYVDAPYSLVAGLKTESRQNFTNTGRNGPRVKTKTVLKPVNKKEQLGGMPKMKKDKNLNKNPPTVTHSIFALENALQPIAPFRWFKIGVSKSSDC